MKKPDRICSITVEFEHGPKFTISGEAAQRKMKKAVRLLLGSQRRKPPIVVADGDFTTGRPWDGGCQV